MGWDCPGVDKTPMRGFWRYSYPVPTSVFISYAHTDRAHKDEIVKHLRSLHHAFDVQPWSDEQIGVGSVYREEIRSALDAASVAILLISVDALNSTFISFYRAAPKAFTDQRDSEIQLR